MDTKRLQRKINAACRLFYDTNMTRVGNSLFSQKTNLKMDLEASTWLLDNGYIRLHLGTLGNSCFWVIEETPHGTMERS